MRCRPSRRGLAVSQALSRCENVPSLPDGPGIHSDQRNKMPPGRGELATCPPDSETIAQGRSTMWRYREALAAPVCSIPD